MGTKPTAPTAILLLSVFVLAFGSLLPAAPPSRAHSAAWQGGSSGWTSAVPEGESGLKLVSSDERGITLELNTPDFQLTPSVSHEGPCDAIVVPGYGVTDLPGRPRLPVRGTMIGVPPQAELRLTVLEADGGPVAGRYDVCPLAQPIVEMDLEAAGGVRYGGVETVADAQAYATAGFYPGAVAEVVATGYVRSQRVAQLRFHPFQYDPVSGELRHNRRILVRVDFEPAGVRSADPKAEEPSFEAILRDILVNYDQARWWRAVAQTPVSVQPGPTAPGQPSYKMLLQGDGVYQVTYADLLAAGMDVAGIDPRTLQVHNQGQEVAIFVAGEQDGAFDPADLLLFYGEGMDTRYTDTNVYWLTRGGANGRRMPERSGSPSGMASVPPHFADTVRWEEDRYYRSDIPDGDGGDHWYGSFLNATGGPASLTYTISAQHIHTAAYSPTLRGSLLGYSSFPATPDHHTRVYLNGHLVDDAFWDGRQVYAFEQLFPHTYLLEGTNVISVQCPFDLPPTVSTDMVLLNWLEIEYHDTYIAEQDLFFFGGDAPGTWEFQVSGFTASTIEPFDVTAPATPTRILSATAEPTGPLFTLRFEDTITAAKRYVALSPAERSVPLAITKDVPSDLHAPTNGADYIIISHRDFLSDVLPLAEHHAAHGWRTMVVDVQDVYDEFSYGVFDPQAIQGFLAYAYANWEPPAPAYVLLVGDGHYDFKDNYAWGEATYVPPYLAYVDPWMGETAADNRFVCVSGEDIFPDMHLGRLPVKTAGEAQAVVAKILGYGQTPPADDWNHQVLFVADDYDPIAGDFAALSDAIANGYLPPPYEATKVYYGVTHTTTVSARAAVVGAINEGRLIVNYIGHAATQMWAFERLLQISSIASLTNTEHLPLMVPMTCQEGYYIMPSEPGKNYSSLGESIVRAAERGAVASWSPTGLGVAAGHDFLNRGLYEAIFIDDVVRLGPATTQGKFFLYSQTGGYRELIDTYLLFGDPGLALKVAPAEVSIAKTVDPVGVIWPGDTITYTLHFSNSGPATAHHVVIRDDLAAPLLNPTVVSAGAAITPHPGTRFTWDVVDLPAGEGGVITIAAVISPAFSGVITNVARIETSAVEENLVNNVAGPTITGVEIADLTLGKWGPTLAIRGDPITYTLTFANIGNQSADQVVITDILPSGLISASVASTGAALSLRPGSRFVWDVVDLGPGEGGTITITAVFTPPPVSLAVTNSAVIATAAAEAQQGNNVATRVTRLAHRIFLPLYFSSPP